jgi:hypothetical protein
MNIHSDLVGEPGGIAESSFTDWSSRQLKRAILNIKISSSM